MSEQASERGMALRWAASLLFSEANSQWEAHHRGVVGAGATAQRMMVMRNFILDEADLADAELNPAPVLRQTETTEG